MPTAQPSLNGSLSNFARRFVVGLTIVRGNVEVLGRLERSRSWHTDNRSRTLGKYWQNGVFVAGNRGSSDTQEIISHHINLLKIDRINMPDVIVFTSAIYDALKPQDRVACIFSHDKSTLHYVNNFSNGVAVGYQPNWNTLNNYKWICLVAGMLLGYFSVSGFSLIGIVLSAVALTSAWVFHLALMRSKEIWEIALKNIQTY